MNAGAWGRRAERSQMRLVASTEPTLLLGSRYGEPQKGELLENDPASLLLGPNQGTSKLPL